MPRPRFPRPAALLLAAGLATGCGPPAPPAAAAPPAADAPAPDPIGLTAGPVRFAVPFDADAYFAVPPPEENAAPLYRDAFAEFGAPLDPADPPDDVRAQREDRIGDLTIALDEGRLGDAPLDALLTELAPGLALLRRAQERPRCVFRPAVGPLMLRPETWAARNAARVLHLKTVRDLRRGEVGVAAGTVRPALRLSRDLQPRGDAIALLVAAGIRRDCFAETVPAILAADGLTAGHCDDLLAALAEHARDRDPAPLLEVERYEQLFWRHLLDRLERGEFEPVREVMRALGMDPAPPATALVTLLYDAGDYGLNVGAVRESAAARVGADPRAAPLLERLAGDDAAAARKAAKPTAAILLTAALPELTAADYGRERAVLDARYEQFEAAAALSDAAEIAQARALFERWTLGEEWRETTVLRLWTPGGPPWLVRSVLEDRLRTDGARCLIAVRRWELERGGPPTDLAAALTAAGSGAVPIDPFSGEPLRLASVDGRPVVYALGPDGADDGGRVEVGRPNAESLGDVIFRLPDGPE